MRHLALAVALACCPLLGSCSLFRPRPPVYDPVVMEAGLVLEDSVVPEEGPVATLGDAVSVHYEMWLDTGELVDSSLERATPIEFVLGDGQAPRGLELGILGMRCYGRRVVNIPAPLGYGEAGLPPVIPPNAGLHMHLELIDLRPGGFHGPEL